MTFVSRRDITFKFIFLGLSTLFGLLIGGSFLFVHFSVNYIIVFDSIIAVLWLFVIWIFIDTRYAISDKEITLRSGPLFRSIALDKIQKVIVGKTAWYGVKFALARYGLLIKYKSGKEVYISPKTNEAFIEELKTKNPPVEIEYYTHQWLK